MPRVRRSVAQHTLSEWIVRSLWLLRLFRGLRLLCFLFENATVLLLFDLLLGPVSLDFLNEDLEVSEPIDHLVRGERVLIASWLVPGIGVRVYEFMRGLLVFGRQVVLDVSSIVLEVALNQLARVLVELGTALLLLLLYVKLNLLHIHLHVMLVVLVHQVSFVVHDVTHIRVKIVYLSRLVSQFVDFEFYFRHFVVVVLWHCQPRVLKHLACCWSV